MSEPKPQTWDEYRQEQDRMWMAALIANGHTPALNEDGSLDIFFHNMGNHNGPGCKACGASWCHHCRDERAVGPCTEPRED